MDGDKPGAQVERLYVVEKGSHLEHCCERQLEQDDELAFR
jgi:hypothetical protein